MLLASSFMSYASKRLGGKESNSGTRLSWVLLSLEEGWADEAALEHELS